MKKIINLITYLFIILVFALIIAYLLTKHYSNKIFSGMYSYAETESQRIATNIINNSLTEDLENELSQENLYKIIKNNQNEIQLIDFNTTKVNQLLAKLTTNIENNIQSLESLQLDDKYIISKQNRLLYNLPIGAISSNVFLSNLGIKIPLKLSLISSTTTNIETEVTEYGLNNALLKIGIKVTINTKITAPFTSKEISTSTNIPISIKIIQGTIPNYYINGSQTNYKYNNSL